MLAIAVSSELKHYSYPKWASWFLNYLLNKCSWKLIWIENDIFILTQMFHVTSHNLGGNDIPFWIKNSLATINLIDIICSLSHQILWSSGKWWNVRISSCLYFGTSKYGGICRNVQTTSHDKYDLRPVSSSKSEEALKRKCHFDELFITGCTGSCHFGDFWWSQWWTFHHNDKISVSLNSLHDSVLSISRWSHNAWTGPFPNAWWRHQMETFSA